MGDEPRRSGRGNKGHHSKIDEAEPTPEPPKTTKPTKGKGKASKKRHPDEGGFVDDDGEWIRCVCNHNEDETEGISMVSCDKCQAWQHNECIGLPPDFAEDEYFCERDAPEAHHDLLLAIEQGSWRTFVEERKTANAKKPKGKKGKGGKKAAAAPKQSSSPMPPEQAKRKHQAEDAVNDDDQASKSRRASTQPTKPEESASKKRKTGTSVKQEPDPTPYVNAIAELGNTNRSSVATALRKTFSDMLKTVSKKGIFRISDGHTSDSLGELVAIQVEHALFTTHAGDPPNFSGAYKSQFTTINFNIRKNEPLFLQLASGAVTPEQLVKMSSEDMASPELQRTMSEMKEQVDKQSILQQEEGPRIRRTHKGEELIEDQNQPVGTESTISAPPPRRESVIVDDTSPTAYSPGAYNQSPTGNAFPVDSHRPPSEVAPTLDRKSSSNFNIDNVWNNVQSPSDAQQPFQPTAQRQAPPPSGQIRTDQHDPDIDRLLDDEAQDSAPYSPAEYTAPVANNSAAIPPVWNGTIDMPVNENNSVAKFTAAARHVAGSNLVGRLDAKDIFPTAIILAGRIKPDLADSYVSGLSHASSTDVSVFALDVANPDDPKAAAEWEKLFDYLASRQRYGVIKAHESYIRDIYLVPLPPGSDNTPSFLQRLETNLIESPRPRKMLILTYILKWQGDRSNPGSAQATPSYGGPTQASGSVPPPGAAMSPVSGYPDVARQAQAFPPPPQSQSQAQGSGNNLPNNPYTQPLDPLTTPQAPPPPPQTKSREEDKYNLARSILGALIDAPVARAILEQSESVQAESLTNLKFIMEQFPETRADFAAFQEALGRQGGGR